MSNCIIETKNLPKKHGDFVAVDSLNLKVRQGEVFGPNGSGKTTTILMLLGLTEPTLGKVQVLGLDPTRHPLSVKSRVGVKHGSGGCDLLRWHQRRSRNHRYRSRKRPGCAQSGVS